MESTHVEIELINWYDQLLVSKQLLGQDEVRSLKINARIAKKAMITTITEKMQDVLQLSVVGKELVRLKNNGVMECPKVGILEVRYKEYSSHCSAIVIPDDEEPLLGLIPIADMRLIIDPQTQQLIPDPRPSRLPTLIPAR